MKPPIDLSPLHPVFQQALAPFVLPPIDPDAVAYNRANDARALAEQINRPQTVEGWFI